MSGIGVTQNNDKVNENENCNYDKINQYINTKYVYPSHVIHKLTVHHENEQYVC